VKLHSYLLFNGDDVLPVAVVVPVFTFPVRFGSVFIQKPWFIIPAMLIFRPIVYMLPQIITLLVR